MTKNEDEQNEVMGGWRMKQSSLCGEHGLCHCCGGVREQQNDLIKPVCVYERKGRGREFVSNLGDLYYGWRLCASGLVAGLGGWLITGLCRR